MGDRIAIHDPEEFVAAILSAVSDNDAAQSRARANDRFAEFQVRWLASLKTPAQYLTVAVSNSRSGSSHSIMS